MRVIITAKDAAATSITVADGTTLSTRYGIVAEGTDWGNAVVERAFAGRRGTQGRLALPGDVPNRPVTLGLRIYGASADDLADALADLARVGNAMNVHGGELEVRLSGQTGRQFLRVLAGDVRVTSYGQSFEARNRVLATLTFTCAPYVEGDSYDLFETFASASLADWSITGSGVAVSGGALTQSSTANKRLLHTARYRHRDVQVTAAFTSGASVTGTEEGVILRWSDSNNYLVARWVGTSLFITKVVASVATNLATTAIGARTASTKAWVRGRTEGHLITAEAFLSEPTPMSTPTATASYVLSTAEQATFLGDDSYPGLYWTPGTGTDHTADDFAIQPFTYRNRSLPELLEPRGRVRGDAPALMDISVAPSGGGTAPAFALYAWDRRPHIWNRAWNGDFEIDTDGWTVAAVSGVSGAATSITRVTTAARYGTASGQVVTPATANVGAKFPMWGMFRRGVPYTFSVWVRAASGTTAVRLIGGVSGDQATSTPVALSTTWTQHTVTWTPTADRTTVYLAVEQTAATATTFTIDGAMAYDARFGAPTLATQTEGRGGPPPIGILSSEARLAAGLTGWSSTADATGLFGTVLRYTGTGTTLSAFWYLDPNLVDPEPGSGGELSVEVWARMSMPAAATTVRAILGAYPSAAGVTGTIRYAQEWGIVGKPLLVPTSGTRWKMYRLGTLRLFSRPGGDDDGRAAARWALYLAITMGAMVSSSVSLDYLLLAPVTRRAAAPSGKVLDGTYPTFTGGVTAERERIIRSDLTGATAVPGRTFLVDHGLGGAYIEPPSDDGELAVLTKLSSVVPDDPNAPATDEQTTHAATVHLAVTPRWNYMREA